MSRHRGVVEDGARRRLGVPRLDIDGGELERIAALRRLLSGPATSLSAGRLPEGRREAVRARVLDELEQPRAPAAMRRSEAIGRSAAHGPRTGGAGS